MPYNSTENENIRNMDLTYDAYHHLYTTNDGQRNNIVDLHLGIPDDKDDNEVNNFLQYAHVILEEIENNENGNEVENNEMVVYNDTNELVKIFIEPKCVVCLENDSFYVFRNCGLLCICEYCYKNTNITKCVICRS